MRRWLLLGILLLAGGLVASAWWLFSTPQGLGLFLASLSRIAQVKITVGATSGRLADAFELRRVEVRVPQVPVAISVRTVRVSWRPVRLLASALAIDRFELDDVVVEDGRPETEEPLTLKWPLISGLPAEFARDRYSASRRMAFAIAGSGRRAFSLDAAGLPHGMALRDGNRRRHRLRGSPGIGPRHV